MAQAVFDEHPIEQYLREYGEVPELMPGGAVEFAQEPSLDSNHTPFLRRWLPRLVRPVVNAALHLLESTGMRSPSPGMEFAEKFKYIVISSPLLSSSLASSLIRTPTPTTPGHYARSRRPSEVTAPASEPSSLMAFSLACLIPAALIQGYLVSSVAILAAVKIYTDGGLSLPASQGDESWSLTLESLEMLISANIAWDNVVSEALSILEAEERACASPSSSLRIALTSSLHTTQSQCDNVRPLLAALTAPAALPQLAEMYAPPSPTPMHSSLSPRTRPASLAPPPRTRPASFAPSQSTRTLVSPQFSADKRATWNGSYVSLARGTRRRSHLATLLREEAEPVHQSIKGSASAPSTPSQEPLQKIDPEEEPFGLAALDLQRKRRSLLFDDRPSQHPHSPISPPPFRFTTPITTHAEEDDAALDLRQKRQSRLFERPSLTSAAGSRFTALTPGTSSSLANMHLALRNTLAAKRFAAAHLLALRFPPLSSFSSSADDSDEYATYWEDVRSVLGLLTSTLEDTTARLSDAISQEAEESTSSASAPASPPSLRLELGHSPQSFAPVPSHLARLAAHVDALSAALDNARENLCASVAALKEEEEPAAKALERYERLRSGLGVALRECERGRGTLLELVERGRGGEGDGEGEADGEGERDGDEVHARDFSSGESDKTLFSMDEQPEHGAHESVPSAYAALDDASAHLMMAASAQHLPRPGIEQVFESLSAAPAPFARERSKLTREERIRLARARRESGSATTFVEAEEPRQGRWGPGGEVVQELKDVIWKVGEQRRKMVERSLSPTTAVS